MPFITVSAQLKSLFTYLKRSDRIGFSQPRMTQSRRNPQLRHAAAGSRRNGFRHSGVPNTQGPSIPEQNRNPPDPVAASTKGSHRPVFQPEQSERAAREPEQEFQPPSPSDSRQSPALSHLSTLPLVLDLAPSLLSYQLSLIQCTVPPHQCLNTVVASRFQRTSRRLPYSLALVTRPVFTGRRVTYCRL